MLRDHELHSLQRFGASGAHSARLRWPAARLLNVNVTQTGYGDVEVTETGGIGGEEGGSTFRRFNVLEINLKAERVKL